MGYNGEVWYDFTKETKHAFGHLFSIDSITGIISNTKSLDCELLGREVILEVIAYDMADNFSSLPAKVIVNIEDINDHMPEIIHDIAWYDSDKFECLSGVNEMKRKVYPIFIKEVANTFRNQTIHISFSVTDKDNNYDNVVSCQIVQSNIKSGFRLENVNENVYQLCFPCYSESVKDFESMNMNLFDREMQDCHFVVISCSDTDDKISFTSDVTFVISLEDINDNKPKLEFQQYHFTTTSRALCDGEAIGQFKSIDPDENDNGKLRVFVDNCTWVNFKNYSENAATLTPKLNVNDGILRFVKFGERISCEESYYGLHECIIKVEDFGLPKLSSSSSVFIFIDPSQITPLDTTSQKCYSMFIRENQPRHTFIGNIRSYLNVNASLLKVLSSDNTDIYFDPVTGSISTLISLDYELKNCYKLSILMMVKNNSREEHDSEINVDIHVLDENDNSPIILYPRDNDIIKVFQISHVVSLDVCNIVAIDHDDGANGEIDFQIMQNESSRELELVLGVNFKLLHF